MKNHLSRRDFLQLSGILTASALLPTYVVKPVTANRDTNKANILIILFDAWSAANTSLYGYNRQTTPNLERLVNKAVVYHNHYSGGNFTTPGTASLLTGSLPWSHRAYLLNETVHPTYARKSIFHTFKDYHRIAYTHNPIANTLLRQFIVALDSYIPMHTHYLDRDFLVDGFFSKDRDIATVSVNRALKQEDSGYAYSLLLSKFYGKYKQRQDKKRIEVAPDFPRGIPNYDGISYFTLEQGIEGVLSKVEASASPFLGYYHFLPPHNPYTPRLEFLNQFKSDGYLPDRKPNHFSSEGASEQDLDKRRRYYDEFILYVDDQFARLYQGLEARGLLENTWLVLTSDHGEMFERGILGHMTASLHQPVIHTPLVIFPPGQQSRVDITEPTSAIDLLPTLASVSENQIPTWAEGRVLPPFETPGSIPDVFAVQVKKTGENRLITRGTVMLVRGQHKLTWYFGYPELGTDGEMIELYNLEADPQELNDLASAQPGLAAELSAAVKAKLAEMEQPE